MPETSIIIRAFNEERHLPQLLEAIEEQTYLDFEVVVVDSGSFDQTRDIAVQHSTRLIRIDSRDFTFGYSLNVGISNSSGRYVVIASAHTMPLNSSWLSSLIEPLRDKQVAMIYGRQLGTPMSKFSDVQDFKRTYPARAKVLKSPSFFANNANSAIRRDLWESHHFDETLPGLEDVEWAKHWTEKGYLVVYSPNAALFHIHAETWGQVRRRAYREALAARWIGIRGRRDIPIEVLREGSRMIKDLIEAGIEGGVRRKSREIARYRYHKTVGTIRGLLEGAAIEDPRSREGLYFDRSCKAVVIHAPGRATVQDVDIPPVKPGDVMIRVAYAGVCPSDLEAFGAKQSYHGQGKPTYPIVPGHELSGRVVKAGPNVTHLNVGDPVVVERIQSCGACEDCRSGNGTECRDLKELGSVGRNGAYAQFVVMPGAFAHKIPDGLDMKRAALCEPLAAVLKGIRSLERKFEKDESKRCAVVGAGPIGHLAAQILAVHGHAVTVVDRDPLRRGYIESANSAINTSDNLGTLAEHEVLVEATGDHKVLEDILLKSGAGASILLLGIPYAGQEVQYNDIAASDQKIVGSTGSAAEDFREAIEMLSRLDLTAFTENTFRLEEFEAAWGVCKSQRKLKVLLQIDSSMDGTTERTTQAGGLHG